MYLQVTAGSTDKVRDRMRKLEMIPWHESDTVQIIRLVQTDNPGTGSRQLWFFRVHEWKLVPVSNINEMYWLTHEKAVPVPTRWFKAWKG